MKLHELTIHEAHDLLVTTEISSQELTGAVISRIEAVEERVGAYISVFAEEAMTQARQADQELLRVAEEGLCFVARCVLEGEHNGDIRSFRNRWLLHASELA